MVPHAAAQPLLDALQAGNPKVVANFTEVQVGSAAAGAARCGLGVKAVRGSSAQETGGDWQACVRRAGPQPCRLPPSLPACLLQRPGLMAGFGMNNLLLEAGWLKFPSLMHSVWAAQHLVYMHRLDARLAGKHRREATTSRTALRRTAPPDVPCSTAVQQQHALQSSHAPARPPASARAPLACPSAAPALNVPVVISERFSGTKPLRIDVAMPSAAQLAGMNRLQLDFTLDCPGPRDNSEPARWPPRLQAGPGRAELRRAVRVQRSPAAPPWHRLPHLGSRDSAVCLLQHRPQP